MNLPTSFSGRTGGSQIVLWTTAVAVGLFNAWLLVGWRHINPGDLSWLFGDSAQNEIGWEFLRHEKHWTLPLTWISNLEYPTGVSGSYLDFIPLLAVFFRTFSGFLPENFQYLGLYTVLCCVLQTYFGLRIMSLFAEGDWLVTATGAGFFVLSPILTLRLSGHFPHSSHWIILCCIYYYFRGFTARNSPARYLCPFLVISFVAAAISPYMALFAAAFGSAAIIRQFLESRLTPLCASGSAADVDANAIAGPMSAGTCLMWIAFLFIAILVPLVGFGFVVFGSSQFSGAGYTDYSLNLLGPFNPSREALLIGQLPSLSPEQAFEGYSYLGLGTILLLGIALLRRPQIVSTLWSAPLLPLTPISVVLAFLALSVSVSLGDQVLLTVPVPRFIFQGLSAFRASGRLFWPVYYLLTLGAIVGLIATLPSVRGRRLLLAGALVVQYFDLLPLRARIHADASVQYSSPLVAPDWNDLPRIHRHLVVLPAMQCRPDLTPGGITAWPFLARLAARNDMTLNSAYLGRISRESIEIDCNQVPAGLLRRGFQRDTAYVLADKLAVDMVLRAPAAHYCRRVDGFNLCSFDPKQAEQSRDLADVVAPFYDPGTEFRSERPTPKSLLIDHIDVRPGYGRWTMGRAAEIDFRIRHLLTRNARLTIELSNVNISSMHPFQRAVLILNGKFVKTLMFTRKNTIDLRVVWIPANLFRYGMLNELRFVLPDAIAPRDLGINHDGRPLALAFHRLSIS